MFQMLSLRGLLRCHTHSRALTVSAAKFRDKKEPTESTTDNVAEQNLKEAAAGGGGEVKEQSDSRGGLKEHKDGESAVKEHVASKSAVKEHVASKRGVKEHVASKRGVKEHVASERGVKEHVAPLYNVAWPAVVAGEVQTKDSEPPVEIDVRRRVKGVGVWDAGMEDYPYR